VSSLVHSSTLVTAGVYVLIRYHVLFFGGRFFIKVFSVLTMVVGGVAATLEGDFKKIIAMSTLRQLGIMLFVLSIGMWVLSYLHMMIHAFFKSILFLSAGSLISHNFGGQDSRFYGGYFFGGVGYVYILIRCLSLSGFPFVIGFYSKDTIISSLPSGRGVVLMSCFFLGCFLTVCYRVRLVFEGYLRYYKGFSYRDFSEKVSFVTPLFILFFVCCFFGSFISWFVLSCEVFFFRGFDYLTGLSLFFGGVMFYFAFHLPSYFFHFFSWVLFFR